MQGHSLIEVLKPKLDMTEWHPMKSLISTEVWESWQLRQAENSLAWGFGRRLKCLCSYPRDDVHLRSAQSVIHSPT